MTKSNWIAGAAIVFLVLLVALTFDPLGFMDDDVPDEVDTSYVTDDLDAPGLAGSGRQPLPGEDPREWEGEPVGVLYLQLGKATLTGSVTGQGTPLRFARVRPVLAPPQDAVAVRTRKDGTWEIRGLPDGAHELRASMPDYVSRTVTAPPVAGDQSAAVPPIDLDVRSDAVNSIVVRVTDLYGRPMPGAKVLATTLPWDMHLGMGPELTGMPDVKHVAGTTDERGRVRLGPLVPANYNVVAQTPGYVPSDVDNVVVSEGRVRHVSLPMREGLSLRGVVEDISGNPVEGAIVMGMAVPAFATSLVCRSGADGTFVLEGLRKSQYMIFATHDTQGEVQGNSPCPGPPVKLTLKGAGILKGKVTWEDGSPVSGGQVRPFGAEPFRYAYSMVDDLKSDGTFEVSISSGDWLIRVKSADGHLSKDVPFSIEAGETKDITIKMQPTGVVRGVVMDEDGHHVANAEVYVKRGGMPAEPSREQYARTNADGEFEVTGLSAGKKVFLHVSHPEYRDTREEFTPGPATGTKEVSIRLARGARILGRVTDPEGNGVAGEQVNLMVTFMEARTTFTDDEGHFELNAVTPGTYTMTTGPFEQGARGLSKGGVKVGEEGEVRVDFQSAAAAGRLTGTVTMSGAPAVGVTVKVRDTRGDEGARVGQTDETGTYLIDGIQFGSVRVRAETAQGMTGEASGMVVEGDAPSRVDVQIGSGTIRGRALDEEGNPVSGAWTSCELVTGDGGSQIKDWGHTNSAGVYEVKGLEPGAYRLRMNVPGYAQLLSSTTPVAEGGVADIGDLRLTRGVQITGVAKNDAGSPIEKATASLKDAQGRPVFAFSMATTGSDGRFVLRGIEPGTYTLRVEAAGHAPYETAVDATGDNTSVNGVLTRGGSVAVSVENESGEALPGVRVRLVDGSGQIVTKTISMANFDSGRRFTDGAGNTSLAELAGGTYRITCELQGYLIVGNEPRVSVQPGEQAAVRVVMQPDE